MNSFSLSRMPKPLLYAAYGHGSHETDQCEPKAEGDSRRLGFTRLLPHAFRRREPLQTLVPVVIHVRAQEGPSFAVRLAASRSLCEAVGNLGLHLITFLPPRDVRILSTVSHGFHVGIVRGLREQEQSAASARTEIARERARIQSARVAREGEVIKLLAQGCDGSFLRLHVLQDVDSEIIMIMKAKHPDFERLQTLTRTRERTIQDALESMALRSMKGGLMEPARKPSLRERFQTGLDRAVRAREQRHALLKLAQAQEEARRDESALERRVQQLNLSGGFGPSPVHLS